MDTEELILERGTAYHIKHKPSGRLYIRIRMSCSIAQGDLLCHAFGGMYDRKTGLWIASAKSALWKIANMLIRRGCGYELAEFGVMLQEYCNLRGQASTAYVDSLSGAGILPLKLSDCSPEL